MSCNSKQKNSKYLVGDFGHYWTTIEGNEDIEGKTFKGDIRCFLGKISSLRGAPAIVVGNFKIDICGLQSLEFSPEVVTGDFSCTTNRLTSLKGSPKFVGGLFDCSSNWGISTLEGMPLCTLKGFRLLGTFCDLRSVEKIPFIENGEFKALTAHKVIYVKKFVDSKLTVQYELDGNVRTCVINKTTFLNECQKYKKGEFGYWCRRFVRLFK